jgi:hypothetical protein
MSDRNAPASPPSDEATLERCCRMADIELQAALLQRRRLRTSEPEDDDFVLRWWADLQFFILTLWRLRRAASLLRSTCHWSNAVRSALASFDEATPSLRIMRNVGEHADAYAVDSPQRHEKGVDRQQLEAAGWNGQIFGWLQKTDGNYHTLNVDAALDAADALHRAIRDELVISAMRTARD